MSLVRCTQLGNRPSPVKRPSHGLGAVLPESQSEKTVPRSAAGHRREGFDCQTGGGGWTWIGDGP
ncbi:hypothetical protein OAS39_07295 [Pirellulales bacterium]|nr:hypothetical protein [Pirellulales bacterium]